MVKSSQKKKMPETLARLLQCNRAGLIPGPGESAEAFLKRVDYCLNLKDKLDDELTAYFKDPPADHPLILKKVCEELRALADFAPDWVLLFFSNYQLIPWHGGCAWIFQLNDESPTGAFIQLRKAFLRTGRYLGLYDREELLRHELVHVARMAFQEPKYEEFLAYGTSKSSFRRWFGPIVRSSKEMLFLVFVFGLIIIFDVFLLAMQRYDAFLMAVWLKMIPLILLLLALVRLSFGHRRLKKCLKNLQMSLKDEGKARAVLYRLKDSEIEAFAKMSPKQIQEFSQALATQELRWQLLHAAYFNGS